MSTGERIRDKIAASKRRGMWMGGLPPLGYDVKDKKLVVNEPEAERVRYIYRRYAELGSVLALKEDLDRDKIRSKSRVDRYGRSFGDKPVARGALYLMLQNRLYRGEVVHKQAAYPGEHPAIIDAALWEAVQLKLSHNRIARVIGSEAVEVLHPQSARRRRGAGGLGRGRPTCGRKRGNDESELARYQCGRGFQSIVRQSHLSHRCRARQRNRSYEYGGMGDPHGEDSSREGYRNLT